MLIFVEHIRKLTIKFICLFQYRFSNTVTISPLKGWDTLSVFLLTIYVLKQSAFKSKLSKILKEKYLNEWYSAKQAYSVGKLDTYTKIKNHVGFEKYLNSLSFPFRRDITRLRISSHRFSIEIGRYARIDRTDRYVLNVH